MKYNSSQPCVILTASLSLMQGGEPWSPSTRRARFLPWLSYGEWCRLPCAFLIRGIDNMKNLLTLITLIAIPSAAFADGALLRFLASDNPGLYVATEEVAHIKADCDNMLLSFRFTNGSVRGLNFDSAEDCDEALTATERAYRNTGTKVFEID